MSTSMKMAGSLSVSFALLITAGLFALTHNTSAQTPLEVGSRFTCESGSAVYYLDAELKRHTFPNEATYFSWYADFEGITQFSDAECQQYPLSTNVTIRPGVYLVKLSNLPSVYAISEPNMLRHIESEEIARSLFGDLWNQPGPIGPMREVPDIFFLNYQIGPPITDASEYIRFDEQQACKDINECLGLNTSPSPGPQENGPQNVQEVKEFGIRSATMSLSRSSALRPGIRQTSIDQLFETSFRRITEQGETSRIQSSDVQSINKNNTAIILEVNEKIVVKDIPTASILYEFDEDIIAPRWNPLSSNEIYYFDENTIGPAQTIKLYKVNVRNGEELLVHEFDGEYETVVEDVSYSSISKDGRWMVFLANHDNDDSEQTIISFNLLTRTIGTELDTEDRLFDNECNGDGRHEMNWLSASPLGKYIVIQWEDQARDKFFADRCEGVEVFGINSGDYIGHIASNSRPGDLGIDSDGNEVYISSYFDGTDLITSTALPGSEDFSESFDHILLDAGLGHTDRINCQGPDGLCLISAGSYSALRPFENEVYMISMDSRAEISDNSSALVRRLIQHKSSLCNLDAIPDIALSQDGSLMAFTSDWGDCRQSVDVFTVELPPHSHVFN